MKKPAASSKTKASKKRGKKTTGTTAVPPKPAPIPPKLGYQSHFLGHNLPLPRVMDVASIQLDYLHYSILFNPPRKMPYYTAVNIDAVSYNQLKDQLGTREEMGGDNWQLDPRLDKAVQIPKQFYEDNDFDLGHMVRREDVLWGKTIEEVLAANQDSFYLTNATPQHKDFNRNCKRWKGLEDYALNKARQNDLRLTVFTGCLFSDKDRLHKDIQIPAQYWKVIVMIKTDGKLSATGYLVSQNDLIQDITERGFVFAQFETYQVPLSKIESQTGISFGLNAFDPLQTTRSREIFGIDPILIEEMDGIVF